MQIAHLLTAENTLADFRAPDKARALQELSEIAARTLGLAPERVIAEIAKREGLGSTGVGGGIALPHARLAEVSAPFGLLARLKRPIAFDAIDQKPVDLVFLLLTPAAAQGDHLNALAGIARKLREPERLKAMRAAENSEGLFRAVTA